MDSTKAVDTRQQERESMVMHQLRGRGIRDERVLDAMAVVPRHAFVPTEQLPAAYADRPLPIGAGQTISQPYMVARACELAELGPQDRVLDVGSGSGYQSAVLAKLCERVIAIELLDELAQHARRTLRDLGFRNVEVITGDGTRGHAKEAPYDAILVAAGTAHVPEALLEQLALGGRLVIPLGSPSMQTLTVFYKTKHGFEQRPYEQCVYVPLLEGEPPSSSD